MEPNSLALAPDVFEAVVGAFAEALVTHYRERFARREHQAAPVNAG